MAVVDRRRIASELDELRTHCGGPEADPLVLAIYLEEVLAATLPDDLLAGTALVSPEALEYVLDRYGMHD